MGFDLGGLADMAKNALGGSSFAEKAGDFLKSHGMEYLERLVNPKTDEDKAFQAKVIEFGKGMSVNIMNILVNFNFVREFIYSMKCCNPSIRS